MAKTSKTQTKSTNANKNTGRAKPVVMRAGFTQTRRRYDNGGKA